MIPMMDEINNQLCEKIVLDRTLASGLRIPESYIFPIEKPPLSQIIYKTHTNILKEILKGRSIPHKKF